MELWAGDIQPSALTSGSCPKAHGGPMLLHKERLLSALTTCKLPALVLQEWRTLSIEGQSKSAACADGHIICWQPEPDAGTECGQGDALTRGSLWLFGGRDALGAQVPYLLKLMPRGGGAW